MKQEDEDLLLKDLCGRLPYEVKVKIGNNSYIVKGIDKKVNDDGDWVHCVCSYGISPVEMEFCKPYLFPMSSMTVKQRDSYRFLASSAYASPKGLIDFFHKNHIDYRGLIPKGLAEDATDKNIY